MSTEKNDPKIQHFIAAGCLWGFQLAENYESLWENFRNEKLNSSLKGCTFTIGRWASPQAKEQLREVRELLREQRNAPFWAAYESYNNDKFQMFIKEKFKDQRQADKWKQMLDGLLSEESKNKDKPWEKCRIEFTRFFTSNVELNPSEETKFNQCIRDAGEEFFKNKETMDFYFKHRKHEPAKFTTQMQRMEPCKHCGKLQVYGSQACDNPTCKEIRPPDPSGPKPVWWRQLSPKTKRLLALVAIALMISCTMLVIGKPIKEPSLPPVAVSSVKTPPVAVPSVKTPPVVPPQPHLDLNEQKIILTKLGYINEKDNHEINRGISRFMGDMEKIDHDAGNVSNYISMLFYADKVVSSVSDNYVPTGCIKNIVPSFNEIVNEFYEMCKSAKDKYTVPFASVITHREWLSRIKVIEKLCGFSLHENYESERVKDKFINMNGALQGMTGQQRDICTDYYKKYGPTARSR